MRMPVPIVDGDAAGSPYVWRGPSDAPAGSARSTTSAALQQHLLADLADSPEAMIGLSVALPFCAVHCLCCERDIRAGGTPDELHRYVEHLCHETALLAARIGTGHDLMQLHLGGGSANVLAPHSLAQLMHGLQRHWRLPGDATVTVECDPRRAGWGQFELLHGLGVTEVLFGVLDLALPVQRAIGRLQSAALVDDACGLARSCGIAQVHLDLMAGLPFQTPDSWHDTLQRVIAMAPSRISLRRYRHRPWLAPGQCTIDPHALPDAAGVHALLAQGAAALGAVGYRWLGAELFVLDDDPLSLAADAGALAAGLHGHTALPGLPVLGLGRGAVSDLAGSLLWNHPQPAAWQADVAHGQLPLAQGWRADRLARRRRAAAEHLLCHQELPAALLPGDLVPVFDRLARHVPAGGLRRLPDRLVLTAAGRLHLPALCAEVAGLPVHLPGMLPAWMG